MPFGDDMNRFTTMVVTFIVSAAVLGGIAGAQDKPADDVEPSPAAAPQSEIVSSPPVVPPANASETVQPLVDDTDTAVDPASLLPDLPSLPPAKASLIGGTIERLDRVRDQLTVHVFGGSKMRVYFDTRTRIYRDGVEASASDLHQGDRISVDTILDGSLVFARNIRLKTAP